MNLNFNLRYLYRYEQVKQLAKRINALSYRERVLAAATAGVMLLFLWDSMLLGSQLDHRAGLNAESATLETEKTSLTIMHDQLTQTLQLDPNAQEQIRLDRYTQEINRIDDLLKSKTLAFVSPKQMVEVLETLIDREPGLRLTRLESAEPDMPLAETEDMAKEMAAKTGVNETNIYVHGLELSFTGDYFSTLRYVQQIEALQWRFSWAFMSLNMKKYPQAEVMIRLEMLSLTDGWIGA